jgi:hypothetical protein
MRSEAGKVVSRRFTGRIVESGLLILAVALGVGAASAGFSLLANTLKAGSDMLASPAYRELVVSARSSAEEMTSPAVKSPKTSNVALTSSDLDAAQIAPAIAYSYVQNRDDIRFMNSATLAEESAIAAEFGVPRGSAAILSGGVMLVQKADSSDASPGQAPSSDSAPSGSAAASRGNARRQVDGAPPGMPPRATEEDLAKARAQADIVVVDFEELQGFRVTPQFFDAWSLKAASGSLLTGKDAEGDANAIVLGASAAEKIAGAKLTASELVGKKLLTREGSVPVVGILAPYGESSIDEAFFSPYRTYSGAGGAGGPPRMWAFNTTLRYSVSDPSKLDEAASQLSGWFESRFGESQIAISNPRGEAQKLIDRNAGIGILILFLSLSGLFIALVNVSHILMSRGLRMRKGVGIMMALGASRRSVLGLFASEATAVAVAGSLIGGAFAFPLSRTMQNALGLSGGSWLFVLAGVALSWILTMACSIAPAWQNSRIVPADAMRAA